MVHVLCMLNKKGYRHTLRICNTFLFHGNNGYTNMLNVTLLGLCGYCECLNLKHFPVASSE